MTNLNELGTVVSSDILVIGGGLAGLSTAITAKEEHPELDILVVDKATIGWAGQSTKAGNGFTCTKPEQLNVQNWIKYNVEKNGEYMNDQELLGDYAKTQYKSAQLLQKWGVAMTEDKDGKIDNWMHPLKIWGNTGIDLNVMEKVRDYALKVGVRLLNHMQVFDLLTDGDRVIGGCGFDIIEGNFHIFKAKAVAIATAGCHYRTGGMFAGYGEGIAAAYNVGAKMRNAEFFASSDVVYADTGIPAYGLFLSVYNKDGVNISKIYAPKAHEVTYPLLFGMEKEVKEGRGPLYVDLHDGEEMLAAIGGHETHDGLVHLHPHKEQWTNYMGKWAMKYGAPPSDKPEVTIAPAMTTCPIKVDHQMHTTVPGLWAIGSCCYQGQSYWGWVRGDGLGNAVQSGFRGGKSIGDYAAQAPEGTIDIHQVEKFKGDLYAPLSRPDGPSPYDIFDVLEKMFRTIDVVLRKTDDNLHQTLDTIAELQAKLPTLGAKDIHDLAKCHEAGAMLTCAEMSYRSALMRTESRGLVWKHYRHDYQQRNDEDWLKWVYIQKQDDHMQLWTEKVPIEEYPVQPEAVSAAAGNSVSETGGQAE